MENLIQGYDEEDGELVLQALNSPFIKHMDVEYAKLARSIPVPKTSEVSYVQKKQSGLKSESKYTTRVWSYYYSSHPN